MSSFRSQIVQPNAPGLAVQQPVSQGANLARQMLGLAGIAGQLAGVVGAFAGRQADIAEREDRQVQQAERGLGSQHATEFLPILREQITSGSIQVPSDVTDRDGLRNFYGSLLDTEVDGQSESYKNAFKDILIPRAISQTFTTTDANRKTEQGEFLSRQQDFLSNTPGIDAEDVLTATDMLKTVGLTQNRSDDMILKLAESAASGTNPDEDKVGVLLASLGKRRGIDSNIVKERLKASLAQGRVREVNQVKENVIGMMQEGISPTTIKEEFDEMSVSFKNSEIAQVRASIGQYEKRIFDATKKQTQNQLERDIINEDGTPEELNAEVLRRMNLPETEVQNLSPDNAIKLINRITNTATTTVRNQQSRGVITGQERIFIPLPTAYDESIITEMERTGSLSTLEGSGGKSIRQFNQPLQVAVQLDRNGRVPSAIRTAISSAMSGDMDQARSVATTIAFMHKQNPKLTEELLAGMDDQAALRTRFVLDQLDQFSPSLDPNTGVEGFQTQMAATVETYLQKAFNLQPVDIPQDLLITAAWGFDPVNDKPFNNQIFSRARDQLDSSLESLNLSTGNYEIETLNEYKQIYEKEFQFAMAINGQRVESARRMASAKAIDRFLIERPPIRWDGEMIFTNAKGQVTTSDFEALVVGVLKDEKFTNSAVNDILDNYRPVWNESFQGWQFNNNDDVPYTTTLQGRTTGTILVINPYDDPIIESIEDRSKRWKESALKRRKSDDQLFFQRMQDLTRFGGQ